MHFFLFFSPAPTSCGPIAKKYVKFHHPTFGSNLCVKRSAICISNMYRNYIFVEFLTLFTFHFLYGQPFDPDKCYKLAMHNFLLMKYPKILWLH